MVVGVPKIMQEVGLIDYPEGSDGAEQALGETLL
jgi:hypothetical protein